MPIQIHALDDGKGVEVLATGVVTGQEVLAANREVYVRDTLEKLRYKLIDRTHCTHYAVTPLEMKIVAMQDVQASKINADLVIVLVTRGKLQYGMTRMWQLLSEKSGFRTKIFKDRESADAWLDANVRDPGDVERGESA